MDASFIPIETVPSKKPFGLDELRRSYKTSLSAEEAIAAAPAVGTADETFPNMFLMPISTPESAESATRIDLVYMGCLAGDEGDPTLPTQQHESDTSVQSAQSSFSSSALDFSSFPVSIQFYAPNNTLNYFSFEAEGTDLADDPTLDPVIIMFTIGSLPLTAGITPDMYVAALFATQIDATQKSREVVPGKFWLNTSRKIKHFVSVVVPTNTSGAYLIELSGGVDYVIGDTLTITAGGETATVDVTAVRSNGNVLGWTVTSNTFTVAHATLAASGGSGAGCTIAVAVL